MPIQSITAALGDQKVITVFIPGQPMPFCADSTHPNFAKIVAAVEKGDEAGLPTLFDAAAEIAKQFKALSERVSVAAGRIYFDGDEIHNTLTEQVRRFLDEGVEDYKPLVKFFEKVQANPSQHSRDQLYEWLTRHKFTITDEGDLLGYKGVKNDLTSVHAGPAIVDGKAVNGHVPNNVGSTIEIARGQVVADSSVGCSVGLHVGTWEYARKWGPTLLEVHVNPRDVVSVPTDCNAQKVRVCRYKVVAVHGSKPQVASAVKVNDPITLTRDALRKEAARLNIAGRGSMTKQQLLVAVKRAK